MHTPLAADGVHRDDVGVVQLRRRLRLGLEPLQLPRVQGRGERQHLQRDAAVEGHLLRLVHDAHAAAAQLADDAEVAQPTVVSFCTPASQSLDRGLN